MTDLRGTFLAKAFCNLIRPPGLEPIEPRPHLAEVSTHARGLVDSLGHRVLQNLKRRMNKQIITLKDSCIGDAHLSVVDPLLHDPLSDEAIDEHRLLLPVAIDAKDGLVVVAEEKIR